MGAMHRGHLPIMITTHQANPRILTVPQQVVHSTLTTEASPRAMHQVRVGNSRKKIVEIEQQMVVRRP